MHVLPGPIIIIKAMINNTMDIVQEMHIFHNYAELHYK